MYIDNTITTEFTGYYDSTDEVYVYPSARQNAVIAFDGFYLSAADGDFTTDGLTISTNTGDSTDISIGKATSAVLSAAILNPDDKMASLSWGEGAVRIGFVSNVSSAMVYSDSQAVIFKAIYYGFNAAGRAFAASTVGGPLDPDVKPLAAVVYNDNTARYYYSDGSVYYYNGNTIATDTANAFMTAKFANREDAPIAMLLDADGFPRSVNDITNNTFTAYKYVPMGVYDFSTVDAYNITFSAEAYDRMIAFDADATDWVQNLDFTNPKTVSGLVGELMTEMGFSYTIPASAVNTALTISKNPITDYSVSYRQILAWLAETMGCNVRMSRTGSVEFYTYSASPVMTITPDVIASQTREVSRYTIPQITRVVCYNTLGAAYTSGTAGQDYTILGNPFLDPSASTACIDNLLTLLSAIPAFNTTSFTDACADPRIDAGDFLTVERTDSTTYLTPVMNQTLTWRGMCVADYASTGNQTREVPSSEAMSAFEGTVNSNPSAVIAKIEAEGISADWITSGKLTVLDSNDNVIFDADKDTRSVSIAGFDVSNTRLHGEKERTSSGTTYTDFVNVDTDDISVGTIWNTTSAQTAELSRGALSIVYDTGNIENRETARVGNGAIDLQSTRTSTASMGSVSLAASGGSNDIPEDEGMTFDNPALKLTAGMSGISSELSANTLRFEDNGTVSSMQIYSLTHSSTSTAETTYTKDIPYGTYLFLHSRQTTPVSAAQGAQLVVIGQTAGTSALITLLAGGSDLTATSGTRSQVSIGNTQTTSGYATVTWTISGRSYRRLVMVRLM